MAGVRTTQLSGYRGRLAPSPTGLLHLGHARTFWTAQQRARAKIGTLVLRVEDLDHARCRPEFVSAMFEDLHWFGFEWQEGPDRGGALGPYSQSERGQFYLAAFNKLRDAGFLYPCACSRQDVLRALQAPHAGDDEPIYPGTCRPNRDSASQTEAAQTLAGALPSVEPPRQTATRINWRFRVPDGQTVSFTDLRFGSQQFVAGKEFGDFVAWRHDNIPAYQLAVVVDDAAMGITEVVRGEDLLASTARQLLLYQALDLRPPQFYHCPLVMDEAGARLAKRHDALSLRALREKGLAPEALKAEWGAT